MHHVKTTLRKIADIHQRTNFGVVKINVIHPTPILLIHNNISSNYILNKQPVV